MKRSDFSECSPGQLKPTWFIEESPSPGGAEARPISGVGFVPDRLPANVPVVQVLTDLWPQVIAAERNLSQLEGAAHRLENPHLLIGVFSRREAILSSRIENTFASAEQLALFDHDPSTVEDRGQVHEVRNYVRAIEHGLASDLPVCLRLIREMHEVLLQGANRDGVTPGHFRKSQNIIGTLPSLSMARFVPPPPEYVDSCMNDLEQYINQENQELPRLIRFGLIHYQFEAIHPFLDGNGRVGRMLATLMTCREGQLSKPFVYLSGFFEQNREQYYDLLYRVSTQGAWIDWLGFFLDGIATQAEDAIHRVDKLLNMQADYHRRVREKRASALLLTLVDELFVDPSITVSRAESKLSCSNQTASNLIDRLVDKDILVEATRRKHGRIFYAPEILQLIYS